MRAARLPRRPAVRRRVPAPRDRAGHGGRLGARRSHAARLPRRYARPRAGDRERRPRGHRLVRRGARVLHRAGRGNRDGGVVCALARSACRRLHRRHSPTPVDGLRRRVRARPARGRRARALAGRGCAVGRAAGAPGGDQSSKRAGARPRTKNAATTASTTTIAITPPIVATLLELDPLEGAASTCTPEAAASLRTALVAPRASAPPSLPVGGSGATTFSPAGHGLPLFDAP